MALSWTNDLRENVCNMVVHKTYNDLRTHEKVLLDNNQLVPSTAPGGIAGHALTYLRQFAQWYEQAGTGVLSGPSAWEHVYAAETAYRFAMAVREPQFVPQFKQLLDRAWRAAADSYTLEDASASTSNALTTLSLKKIRFYVINALIRRRPPMYVSVAAIDQAVYAAYQEIWNRGSWNFRRRLVTMNIASNGTVTFTGLGAGESFAKVNATQLYYSDSEATSGTPLRWADADEFTRAKAAASTSSTTTGRPLLFRVEPQVAGTVWNFCPEPDQAYTLETEVLIATPATWSDANDATPFSKLPADFYPALCELTLGKILSEYDVRDKNEYLRRALEKIDVLLPTYQSPGAAEDFMLAPRDVYGDLNMPRRYGL